MTQIEVIARALCRFEGNPENTQFEGRPMWQSYLDQAKAVAQALEDETAKNGKR